MACNITVLGIIIGVVKGTGYILNGSEDTGIYYEQITKRNKITITDVIDCGIDNGLLKLGDIKIKGSTFPCYLPTCKKPYHLQFVMDRHETFDLIKEKDQTLKDGTAVRNITVKSNDLLDALEETRKKKSTGTKLRKGNKNLNI